MRGPLQNLNLVLLLLFALWEMCWSFASAYGLCPIALPCHCLTEAVYCAFKRLPDLPIIYRFDQAWKELDLSENFLSTLPENGFEKVRVMYLNLERNTITDIHPKAFQGMKNVTMLDLSHNHIKTLPARVFEPLEELHSLKLKYNQIKVVDGEAFHGIAQLSELDLTGNELERVPVIALQPLLGLKRLILRNNRLLTVDPFAFNELPLEYLDLGSNGDGLEIQEGAFCGLEPQKKITEPQVIEWTGLNTILLDHNGLSGVSTCLTKLLWTLTLVDLSGNPLNCSCELLTLRDLVTKTEFPGAQCARPKRYAGQYLSEIVWVKPRCNETLSARPNYCSNICRSLRPVPPMTQISGASDPHLSVIVKTLLLIWMGSHVLTLTVTLVTTNIISIIR